MTNKELASIFKVLGDENRLIILEKLIEGEQCACTLITLLNISQPTLSHHLKMLEKVGLTKSRKVGTWKRHSLNSEKIAFLHTFLQGLSVNSYKGESHE